MDRPEYDEVERLFIDQLVAMGWTHLEGAPPGHYPNDPALSGRQDFESVVMEDRFRERVRAINPGPDGMPWLDDQRLQQISEWLYSGPRQLVPANIQLAERLRVGGTVEGLPGWNGPRTRDVRLIAFDMPEDNDFLAVSQFRIDSPGRRTKILDLVLFVNGLPLVVVECKRPGHGAIDAAIEQVHGYASAAAPEPVVELVRFAQLLIGSCREQAQVGTITSELVHFMSWRTVEPGTIDLVRRELGKPADHPLTQQETLIGGMLRPDHLLSLLRDFMVTGGAGSSEIKVLARWQQFRAVNRILELLRERESAIRAGIAVGQLGGVVWHTQGSGKSLTMAFLVRCLRTDPELVGFKVVVVTDRRDLQGQIGHALGASGERVLTAGSVDGSRQILQRQTPDLVMITIQKAQGDDTEASPDDLHNDTEQTESDEALRTPVLNASANIVVLVDEAHRSQDGVLHARLRAMLPNASMIGFTGTPIVSGRKKLTEAVFGPLLDVYALTDAQVDGAVVPVRYEARLPRFSVIRPHILDEEYEKAVAGTRNDRRRQLRELARKREVLEAQQVIEFKARDMFWHWVRNAMPDRFGAQIVAVSRKAAVRYRESLLAARDELVDKLDRLDRRRRYDPSAQVEAEARELIGLLDWREVLRSLDAAVVISVAGPGKKDPREWSRWTLPSAHADNIERFRAGIPAPAMPGQPWAANTHGAPGTMLAGLDSSTFDPWSVAPPTASRPQVAVDFGTASGDPVAFVVVQSMLLTGFDAPVEQVLYLDRAMGGVELLQAIARTNRPYRNKTSGLIVDYVGVYRNLRSTLKRYEQEHLRQVFGDGRPGARTVWSEFNQSEVPELGARYQRVADLVESQGIGGLDTPRQRENLLAALEDPDLRAEYDERVRDFLKALNTVLPRQQALPYVKYAKYAGEVQYLARFRYREEQSEFNPRRFGAKVRALIDAHLLVRKIEQRVPPRDLTDPAYLVRVGDLLDDRARALEMAHALRSRIDVNLPLAAERGHYENLSDRLDHITKEMEQDFEQAALALFALVEDERAHAVQEASEDVGYFTLRPVQNRIAEAICSVGWDVGDYDLAWCAQTVTTTLSRLTAEPNFTDPEGRVVRRESVARVVRCLEDDCDFYDDDGGINVTALATDLVDLTVRRAPDFRRWRPESTR